jgi:thioredoxin reductase (NADPH)
MNKTVKNIDLLIIGAGAAGLTAGLYAARLKLDTLIIENELVGGQIRDAYVVENYPGFNKISGSELTDRMQEQSKLAGAIIDEFDQVLAVKLTDDEKIIETENYLYKAGAVIIASGAKRKELPIPEEKQFHGNGIHYCEICDGHLYEGKHVGVIGGGGSAVGAAIFLTKYASKVTLIHHSTQLRADKTSQAELFANEKIEILWNSEVKQALGTKKLEAVIMENPQSQERRELKLDGLFVYIGSNPSTEIYQDYVDVNAYGNIIAGENCETNVQGVFAAGDVRQKPVRQLTTAVSDGTVAALLAEKYIVKNKQQTRSV